jgi:glycosyltransferase involved in cell wall biosynthesis
MAEPTANLTFCLIIPSGTWDVAALAEAITTHHPSAAIVGVWCGDPHHRPVLPAGITWADLSLTEPMGIGWGLLLVGLSKRAYEWSRACAAIDRLLQDNATSVVLLRVGSVALVGPMWAMIDSAPITLVGRSSVDVDTDGSSPGDVDMLREGSVSIVMAAFQRGSEPALRWLGSRLIDAGQHVGPWLERMGALFDASVSTDVRFGTGAWKDCDGATPVLLDLDDLDRDEPWHFAIGDRPTRVRLSKNAVLARVVNSSLDQIAGVPLRPTLPGGILVDDAMSALVIDAIRAARLSNTEGPGVELPALPFGSDNSRFVQWLESSDPWTVDVGRYWMAARLQRADLQTVFPQPLSVDRQRFTEWIGQSWRLESDRSVLIRSHSGTDHSIRSTGRDTSGINVVGYLDFDQSQGHIARRLVEALEAAAVSVTPLNFHRSQGSRRASALAPVGDATFQTNLVVVNADQFEFVAADHGESLLAGRRTIGYWFWELEDVPKRLVEAIDHVDEIWTGSQFIADTFAAVTDKPVTCVPLPVAEPKPSARTRATMGIPDDHYVFLTTFDQFSVPERKNPFGTIEAFTRAFTDGEGPLLLIKTMNGDRGWKNHERLLLAAAGRTDIVIWDEHLTRADQMAVLANVDCLVSLHRSEGLGLHCAEAMWLSKPVIATRYSGNLDFMDDTVAAMIDYTYVNVRHGEGIYPETAMWADPDLGQAAAWMRRLVDEPTVGRELGVRARQRMQQQPTMADTGRLMARLAGLQ